MNNEWIWETLCKVFRSCIEVRMLMVALVLRLQIAQNNSKCNHLKPSSGQNLRLARYRSIIFFVLSRVGVVCSLPHARCPAGVAPISIKKMHSKRPPKDTAPGARCSFLKTDDVQIFKKKLSMMILLAHLPHPPWCSTHGYYYIYYQIGWKFSSLLVVWFERIMHKNMSTATVISVKCQCRRFVSLFHVMIMNGSSLLVLVGVTKMPHWIHSLE